MFIVAAIASASLAVSIDDQDKLKPITDILKEETSEQTLQYALSRCAAAYVVVSELLGSNNDNQDIMSRFKLAAEHYLLMAATASIEAGGNGEVSEVISSIADIYISESNEYYLRSANTITSTHQSDITFCGELLEMQDQQPEE